LVETGETEVWVERAGTLLGRIRLRDEPSAEASDVLRALRREGLHVRLLSGDAEAPVRHLAEVVGLVEEEIRWGARPSDKAREIQSWEAEGKRVLFVGDGINDAPALAAATLGVAVMGATDAARASAGMVVRDGSLVRVVELLTIGRETAARTRLSVGWAITYNALAIPLAALGWFGPGLAALGMVLSSLAVTWNAVRGNSGPNERLVAVGGVVPRLNPR
jgi:Cu2+-exporting ATPase